MYNIVTLKLMFDDDLETYSIDNWNVKHTYFLVAFVQYYQCKWIDTFLQQQQSVLSCFILAKEINTK